MRGTESKQKAVKRYLSLILTLGLVLSIAMPLKAANAEAPAELNNLILEAKAVDLSSYPAKYADPVKHMIAKAEKVAANADEEDEQRNIARLELQVALDTLKIDLQLATVLDIHELVKAGKLTYEGLTQMYLTRIELYDFNTNKLNSIRALNPNALSDAKARDAAFAQNPGVAKGMFGIPVLMKDNINFMGLPTTAGSVALVDNFTPYDAPLVTNLKKADAIILGKLNLTEFANGVSNSMAAGFSSLAGQVLNPYRPVRLTAHGSTLSALSPSGSSSGSGAATAAALAAVTIGTETGGSILSPSSSNHIVGVKPTVGIISRYGVVPLSSVQDTTGPMVRNVTDAAILLNATYGYDPNDPVTEGIEKAGLTGFDFTDCLKPGFLVGKRIGVVGQPTNTTARIAFNAALQALTTAGATLVYQTSGDVLAFPSGNSPNTIVTNFNFKRDIIVYLATLSPNYPMKSLQDILNYYYEYMKTKPEAFQYGVGRMEIANNYDMVADLPLYEADRSADITWSRTNGIDWLVDTYNLDGYVCTTNQSQTNRTAKAGYPNVQIPLYNNSATQLTGQVAMTFAGAAFAEPVLIAAAYVAEQAIQAIDPRVTPGLAGKNKLGDAITAARELPEGERAQFQAVYNAAVAAYTSDFTTQMDADKADDALRTAMAYEYTVTFVDWDGKVLKTQSVEHGKSATAPPSPKREGYAFTGWDKNFSNVTEEMTITAQYEKDEGFGCNAIGYGYLVFALFGAVLFVLKKR